jgi:SET domain-containing protein
MPACLPKYGKFSHVRLLQELVRYLTKVLDYNCFSGEEKGCLFGTPSFINHACIPNCIFAIDEECQGKLVAVRDIDVGEGTSISQSQFFRNHYILQY